MSAEVLAESGLNEGLDLRVGKVGVDGRDCILAAKTISNETNGIELVGVLKEGIFFGLPPILFLPPTSSRQTRGAPPSPSQASTPTSPPAQSSLECRFQEFTPRSRNSGRSLASHSVLLTSGRLIYERELKQFNHFELLDKPLSALSNLFPKPPPNIEFQEGIAWWNVEGKPC